MVCNIDLSIIILTYNHEHYITHALESVLEQKTNFRYEIIIGDDCSSDDTIRILKRYKQKFPSIINIVLHDFNVGTTKNYCDCVKQSSGNFVTCFGGDDYWICDSKIEFQMKWLRENPSYLGVGHGILIKTDDGKLQGQSPGKKMLGKDVSINDFKKDKNYPLPSVIYRNLKYNELFDFYMDIITFDRFVDDLPISLILLLTGKIYIIDNFYSVYRLVNSSHKLIAHNYNSIRTTYQKTNDHFSIYRNLEKKLSIDLTYLYVKRLINYLLYCIKFSELEKFLQIFEKLERRIKFFFWLHLPKEFLITALQYIKRKYQL